MEPSINKPSLTICIWWGKKTMWCRHSLSLSCIVLKCRLSVILHCDYVYTHAIRMTDARHNFLCNYRKWDVSLDALSLHKTELILPVKFFCACNIRYFLDLTNYFWYLKWWGLYYFIRIIIISSALLFPSVGEVCLSCVVHQLYSTGRVVFRNIAAPFNFLVILSVHPTFSYLRFLDLGNFRFIMAFSM